MALNIDRDLLEAAKDILGTPTSSATVNEALRRVVAAQPQQPERAAEPGEPD